MMPAKPNQISAAIADATGRAADSVHEQNKKLLATLLEMPCGREMFRRELAKRNVDLATFERLLRGDARPEDTVVLAGLTIARS